DERVEPETGVTAANVDALADGAAVVPLDGGAVSRILGRNAEPRREEPRADVFQSDQANPNHADAADELGPKRSRQQRREDGGIDVVVDQNAAVDDPADDRNLHDTPRTTNRDPGA